MLLAIPVLAAGIGAAVLLRGGDDAPSTAQPTAEEPAPALPSDTAETPGAPTRDPAIVTPAPMTPPVVSEPPDEAAPPVERTEPLLVGFMDDASFRWHPARARMLDRARATGARVIRALVQWHLVAPKRPAPGAAPFVKARLFELDELVASAEARGMEVMLTIWGTPAWAGGKAGPNRAPTDLDALRDFAEGLASRYPSVRRFSVWNEPNTQLFLAPQFDAAGHSVAPRAYAAIFRAAHEGIKVATPDALVAIGETGSHGRDAPSKGDAQDRHSPARFAQLLSMESPDLEFDAWAHHPYPVHAGVAPEAPSNWPVVTLSSLDRFARALDHWFDRDDTQLWITEVGYEAAPAEPTGLPENVQAEYAARAIALAAAVPQVTLFVWFTFADHEGNRWQSGLVDAAGKRRPVFASFTAAVRASARAPS
jgi:Cellulase (glycosyl hydrolase family 5)